MAKIKGFNEKCVSCYAEECDGEMMVFKYYDPKFQHSNRDFGKTYPTSFTLPFQHQLKDWLRREKGIIIQELFSAGVQQFSMSAQFMAWNKSEMRTVHHTDYNTCLNYVLYEALNLIE